MEPRHRGRRGLHLPGNVGSGRIFLAFQNTGYRWLWTSGVFGAMSRSVDMMAQGWLVLIITDSPFWVGAVAGARGVATLCVSPIAGVIADRVNRRKLIMMLQFSTSLIAFLMAYLVITDLIQLWHIMVLSFLQGIAMTFSMPARMTLTMDLVGKRALMNATAANFMAFSVMQIISPTVGGIVISRAGIGGVYLFIGAGLLGAVAALWRIGHVPMGDRLEESPWRNLKEGVSHVFRSPTLRPLLLMGVVVEMYGFSHMIMLPVIARDVLHVGATGLGLLTSAGGVGALIATFFVAGLGDFKAKGWLLVGGSAGFGLFLILFAASTWFPLSQFLLAAARATAITYDSVMATLLQTNAPDRMRGRVMSFYALTFGMNPIGGIQAGAIAGFFSAPLAIGIGGAIVMLNALRVVRLVPRFQQKEEEMRAEQEGE